MSMTKIEELEQKLNECQKALAELKESKKEKWKPKECEKYWFRNIFGENEWILWENDDLYDNWRYNNILIFKTKEECERYWHFMDTVKEKSYEFSELEWRNSEINKYFICFHFETNKFDIGFNNSTTVVGKLFFRTCEDAQYIIDNFKEELLKYWL